MAESSNQEISEQFSNSFAKVLNRHGYGFQFSVLKKAHELANQKKSAWQFEACEFPVEVQGAGTRIDFVLSREPFRSDFSFVYLIAECKRANPALSNWCFVRAPYTHSNALNDEYFGKFILEGILREENGLLKTFAREMFISSKIYHLAVEVRSNAKGDNVGETGQAIEAAATQVLRSLNGFIQTIFQSSEIIMRHRVVDLMPVIFTTAQLYATNANLSQADLQTGNIVLKTEDVQPMPWLFYEYASSPGLKHSVQDSGGYSLAKLLEWRYLRTIPIVSPSGIEEFFNWASRFETRI
jgi:hypothetical protein